MAARPGGNLKPKLGDLGVVFIRFGSLTFGGGIPTTAALQREIVQRRGWLDPQQFGICYALGQVTPGTNLLAFCVAMGWSLLRAAGALTALLSVSTPGMILVILLTRAYEAWSSNLLAQHIIHGALASAVGIVGASCWQLVRPYVDRRRGARTAVIVAGSVLALARFHLPPVQILGLAALVGLIWRDRRSPEAAPKDSMRGSPS